MNLDNLKHLKQSLDNLNISKDKVAAAYDFSKANQVDKSWWIDGALQDYDKRIVRAIEDYDFSAHEGKEVFVDITALDMDNADFFPGIAKTLRQQLEQHPKTKLTIRYLEGIPSQGTAKQIDVHKRGIGAFRSLARDFSHVQLYYAAVVNNGEFVAREVGKFNAAIDQLISEVDPHSADTSENENSSSLFGALTGLLHTLSKDYVDGNLASWNHSKIFAINGEVLIQGINFWGHYKQKPRQSSDSSVNDLATESRGQATISAHHFCNYLWQYIIELKQQGAHSGNILKQYDAVSQTFKDIKAGPQFSCSDLSKAQSDREVELLAISNLSMISNEPNQYLLPAMDMVCNALLFVARHSDYAVIRGLALAMLKGVLGYCQNSDNAARFYSAYASRYARIQAIKSTDSIARLSQQRLVTDDVVTMIKSLQQGIKNVEWLGIREHKPTGGKVDDGLLWSVDLLQAISEVVDSGYGQKQVQLLLSNKGEAGQGGYADPLTPEEFKQVMQLFTPNTHKIHYHRTTRSTLWGWMIRDTKNHSKLVVIDDKLMYIGSDNAYVTYNQQFGLWIDNKTEIKRFLKGYWQPKWADAR